MTVIDGKGAVVAEFPAWGGDPIKAANGEYGYETTTKGTFTVLSVAPITTKRWPASEVPWGQRVKIRVSDMKVYDLRETLLVDLGKIGYGNHIGGTSIARDPEF